MQSIQERALITNLGDLKLIPKDQNEKPKLLAKVLQENSYYEPVLNVLRSEDSDYLPLTTDNYDDPRVAEVDDLDKITVHFEGTVTLPKKIADDPELHSAFEKLFQNELHQGRNHIKYQKRVKFTSYISVCVDREMLNLIIDDFDLACKYNLMKQKVSFDLKGYAQYAHAFLSAATLEPFLFRSKGHFHSMQNWNNDNQYIIIGLNDQQVETNPDSILRHFKLKVKQINADVLGVSKEQFEILDANDIWIEFLEGQEDNTRLAMISELITLIETNKNNDEKIKTSDGHHVPVLITILKEICKHVENQRILLNILFDRIYQNHHSNSFDVHTCLFNFNHQKHDDYEHYDSYYQVFKTPELDLRIGFYD